MPKNHSFFRTFTQLGDCNKGPLIVNTLNNAERILTLMKTHQTPKLNAKAHQTRIRARGFALVVTLSIMVLLTLLAVGLLSLSTRSIATSTRESNMIEARTNARLALDLAIAQLQLRTGPDQRITMTADQRSTSSDGSSSSAATTRRHWTGVYESWPEATDTRPEPSFLSWLVSGSEKEVETLGLVDSEGNGDQFIELVAEGTVGNAPEGRVKVPAINILNENGDPSRIGWWVGDQGAKAALSTPAIPDDSSIAATRAGMQSAARNAVELASIGTAQPYESIDPLDPRILTVTDWNQAAFLADDKESQPSLFHDLAATSTGLLTNVRAGGFRKDLSMQLELPEKTQQQMPPLYQQGRGRESGINFHELWAYYNLYNELQTGGRDPFTTGGTMSRSAPYLKQESTAARCATDDYFHFKQPVIISYQLVLSFETTPVTVSRVTKQRLQVVADPIITLWNPLDVPVSIPKTTFMSVKYWQVPYDIEIKVNGSSTQRYPLAASLSTTTLSNEGDSNFLSLRFGQLEQLVFKPGEVIKVSQSGNKIVKGSGTAGHDLAGRSGFNYGGGVSLPVRNLSGQTVDLNATDRIEYRAFPNNLTAGKKGSSGNTVTGRNQHTRHFSLTHHEVYMGEDRGGNSLGFGNMAIDWDFGNQRLKPGESRQAGTPGTKKTSERLYANSRSLSDVFKSLETDQARPLTVGQLSSSKAPFLLISYNAKTENGSDLGTKFLSRFNPKAFHVDFYDMTKQERDMLPYELTIEPLVSWKNRSLEVSTNGSAYFGGSMNAEFGSSLITTHSVPREPIVSLGALQHSMANGFEIQRPATGYASLSAREPMLPQISHAIGNSMAPSVLAPNETISQTSGGRYLADHSYLANLALWDDWFFSGIANQRTATFSKSRSQQQVAEEFFDRTAPLPTVRYLPDTDGETPTELLSKFFKGRDPSDDAVVDLASYLRVDGAFNVNLTSIEAWKAVLGALNGRPIVSRDLVGTETVTPQSVGDPVPVTNLHSPVDQVSPGDGNVNVTDPEQWIGRRTLEDEEIDRLARAIVSEVRKRGPFLSLADFVNRRVSNDKELARSGAIQSALDSEESQINAAYMSGSREVGQATASRFKFPEAEEGALAYGIPGIIKQADILTPIAPILTVRSDTFIIRAYGESVDANGTVRARAYCEATVERDRNFINPKDEAETPIANLTEKPNETFGRRYLVKSFRWLNPEEV